MLEPTKAPDAGHDPSKAPEPTKAPAAGHVNEPTVESLSAKVKELESNGVAKEATISNLYKESKGRQAKIKEYEDKATAIAKKALDEETDAEKVRVQLTKEKDDLRSEKDSTIKTLTNQVRVDRVESVIATASARHNAVEPDQVIQLLSGKIGLDDNLNPYVIDKDGTARIGEGGRSMSIDAYVKEYLDKYPNLVKGSNSAGSGSRGTAGGNGGFTGTSIGKMSSKEYVKNKVEIHKAMKAGNIPR